MDPFPIASIQAELIKEAEKLFGAIRVSDISFVAESFDDFLRNYIINILNKNCSTIISGSISCKSSSLIHYHYNNYSIDVINDPVNFDTLLITILRRDIPKDLKKPRSKNIKIKHPSRFNRIKIIYSQEIPVSLGLVSDLAVTIIETGYRWLENAVLVAVSKIETIMAYDLYSYIRTVFQDNSLYKHFWFVSIIKGKIFYLYDELRVSAALSVASQKSASLGYSYCRLTAEMLTCRVPFELAATKEAIAKGSCIDFILGKSKYRESEELLVVAQNIMAGTDSLSTFPIIREGSAFFAATFPTDNRQVIEPLLQQHQSELIKRFTYHQKKIEKILNSVKREVGTDAYRKLGEFLGGFIKSLSE